MAKHLKDLYENEEGLKSSNTQEVILDSKSVGGSSCCGSWVEEWINLCYIIKLYHTEFFIELEWVYIVNCCMKVLSCSPGRMYSVSEILHFHCGFIKGLYVSTKKNHHFPRSGNVACLPKILIRKCIFSDFVEFEWILWSS